MFKMARHTLTCILLMVYTGSLVVNAASTPVTDVSTSYTDVSTSGTGVSTSDTDVSTSGTGVSTSDTDVSTSGTGVSTSHTDVSTSDTGVATSDTGVSTSDTGVSTSDKVVSTSGTDVSTSDTGVSTSHTVVSTSGTDVSTSDTDVSTSDTVVSTPGTDVSTSDTDGSTSGTGVSTSDTDVSTSDTGVATSDTGVSTSDTGVSTSDKVVSTSGTDVSTSDTGVSTSDTVVSTSGTDVSTSDTDVSTSDTVVSTPGTDVSTSDTDGSTSDTHVPTSDADVSTSDTGEATSDTDVSKPVTDVSTTLIPDTFYYNCTEEGDIHIINDGGSLTNLTINYLNQSAVGNCTDPELQTDGSFVLTDCTKNTTVDVVLEVTNGSDIIGGHHSKTFQIKCEDVNIRPYYLNVSFAENVRNEVNTHVISMATKPIPSSISQLTMSIKGQSGTVQEATIGQALTIVITTSGNVDIKPTECKATGNGKEETLWIEAGCKHDKELFGEKWKGNGNNVTNTMYGFRFVGSSKTITITCTVRVCPKGYGLTECDLSRCSKTKRKRINHMSSDITMTKATTSLTIKDTMLTSVTSGAGRLGFEMINTMAFFVAAFAIPTVKFIKE